MDTGILMAFDYGLKKQELLLLIPCKQLPVPWTTIPTPSLKDYVASYTQIHQVTGFVVGYPLQKRWYTFNYNAAYNVLCPPFKGCYPHIPVYQQDERYTSKMAAQTLLAAGVKNETPRQNLAR